MNCKQCGESEIHFKILDEYRADDLVGLPNVLIRGAAEQVSCKACGADRGVQVPDPKGLQAAIAIGRAMIPVRLDGRAVRFLRLALDLRSKEMAQCLMVREETFSRWENGHEQMGEQHEKLLRYFVCSMLESRVPGIPLDMVGLMHLDLRRLAKRDAPTLVLHLVKVRVDRRSQPAWEFDDAA